MTEPTASRPRDSGGVSCHHCGAEIERGEQVCPECGARRTRVCFCGTRLPTDAPECPNCLTPWAKVARVRRRRSRSSRPQRHQLLRRAGTGALAAVIGGVLLNLLISGLAQRTTPDQSVPPDLGARLYYAGQAILGGFMALLRCLTGLWMGPIALLALVGAIVGAGWYLAELGYLRKGNGSWRSRRRPSARRRERST